MLGRSSQPIPPHAYAPLEPGQDCLRREFPSGQDVRCLKEKGVRDPFDVLERNALYFPALPALKEDPMEGSFSRPSVDEFRRLAESDEARRETELTLELSRTNRNRPAVMGY
jgi:hypothetical protein